MPARLGLRQRRTDAGEDWIAMVAENGAGVAKQGRRCGNSRRRREQASTGLARQNGLGTVVEVEQLTWRINVVPANNQKKRK